MEIPASEFDFLASEIKRLEGLVEGRDTEIERLSRGWDASIAELDTERHWREELQSLTIDQAVEIGKLKSAMRETLRVLREIVARDDARLADEQSTKHNGA